MSEKPNILMIMADQLAPQALSFYGNTVCKTPHLDRLAADSVVFDNAYCNHPVCVPSRASMMSGRLTPAIEVWDNACALASGQPTLAHHLRHLGYHTVLSGKMHFIGPDQLHGFEERTVTDVYPSGFDWVADWEAGPVFVPSATGLNGVVDAGPAARTLQEDFDEEVAHAAVQTIYDLARRGKDAGPWFQIASFTSPHTPFVADQKYWDRYDPDDIDLPKVGTLPFDNLDYASRALFFAHGRHRHRVTEDDLRRARHGYYAMISFIDEKVGEILAALKASGQADNTVVLFCADHGEMLGERGMWFKQSFYEWSARVPLMVSAPRKYAPRRVNDCVSLVDLLPTLVGIGGGEVSLPCDGESLEPALTGGATRDLVIADYYGIGPCVPYRMVRQGRFKLIYTHNHPDLLFDLKADPDELQTLADDPTHDETLQRLKSILLDGWDPEDIDQQIRTSQAERLFLKTTPGTPEVWDFVARIGDEARYVRRGSGGVDGTKANRRLPKVEPIEAHFPELSQEDVAAIIAGRVPLPSYLSEDGHDVGNS
ncbi:choline-sulfatase [Sulfitobacter sp. SK011]|uniref:choline-sulfatase n=1 Tax=Sulfitobacter sp. SK011 TaxID=1389004 RepID=UPI0020C74FDC|nr:choline-sulfatase [Sulfitobacter sp. SK011]